MILSKCRAKLLISLIFFSGAAQAKLDFATATEILRTSRSHSSQVIAAAISELFSYQRIEGQRRQVFESLPLADKTLFLKQISKLSPAEAFSYLEFAPTYIGLASAQVSSDLEMKAYVEVYLEVLSQFQGRGVNYLWGIVSTLPHSPFSPQAISQKDAAIAEIYSRLSLLEHDESFLNVEINQVQSSYKVTDIQPLELLETQMREGAAPLAFSAWNRLAFGLTNHRGPRAQALRQDILDRASPDMAIAVLTGLLRGHNDADTFYILLRALGENFRPDSLAIRQAALRGLLHFEGPGVEFLLGRVLSSTYAKQGFEKDLIKHLRTHKLGRLLSCPGAFPNSALPATPESSKR